MTKNKRPTSVSVISWFLITVGGLCFPAIWSILYVPEINEVLVVSGVPLYISVLWTVITGIVVVVSGIGMLRGFNWGRLLYLWFQPISLLLSVLVYGFREIYVLTAIFYASILLLLTRSGANAFFAFKKNRSNSGG